MSNYVLHVAYKAEQIGVMNETTVECEDFDDLARRMKEAHGHDPNWVGMMVIHIEDYPKVMEGAEEGFR